MKAYTPLLLLAISLLASCVPGRRFQEVQTQAAECSKERAQLKLAKEQLQEDLDDCISSKSMMDKDLTRLKQDTAMMSSSLNRMTSQYDKINDLNEQLMSKQSSLMSNSESEKKEMLETLMNLQSDLQTKQTALNALESELTSKSRTLEDRSQRVAELEEMLASKDAAVMALKNRVSDALLNFQDKGLTVEERGGRVYVSLEAKLLFASGSTQVGAEGISALNKLAAAIENEKDLSILVEGHTDSDKILGNSAAYKDNWDLSVLRATSVVRIMMDKSSIDPTQLTAAGRGEYLPVDESDKAKNRRIEIILAPNLDKLFELINDK